jgi:hypothetical protein
MSYYYKYQFVSPDPLYARIQEELKSYFDTGMIDSLMFPIWTEKCLKKLGRSSYKILPAVLDLCNYESRLPPDFKYVREAWMTTSEVPISHQKPGAFYQSVTTCLNGDYVPDKVCNDVCNPELVNLIYKTTSRGPEYRLTLKYLLQPGTIECREKCDRSSPNLGVTADNSFDIQGNKFRTNFREGQVYLLYYSEESDDQGYQLIPDNYRIQEFIEAFIKQKIFEQLYNQVVDETFNQIERKYQLYKQAADEAFIMADIEIKKQTVYDKERAMMKEKHSLDQYIFNMYGTPGHTRGFRHRRRHI